MRKHLLVLVTFVFALTSAFAQSGTVKGRLLDADNGEGVFGATIFIVGTTKGAISDVDGNFSLSGLSGEVTLKISYLGYETLEITRNMSGAVDLGDIQMTSTTVGLDMVEVIASVAIDRKTPVAVSTVKSPQIEAKIGNQEFPEVLKSTPGVFATRAGGGFGDGRINIRGFDDQNVAVLINGIPVNDMENGNVFWSNWAGLTDATSSIQVQRGLGASKVAVPSIGGTINIISKASDRKQGGYGFIGSGNNGYSKVGFQVSTGLQDNGWAVTLSGAKTQGDGNADGLQFLGFSYFANIAKRINDKHELTFTAVGAKQRHGQRVTRQSLATFAAAPQGIRYNADWGMRDGNVVNFEDNFYHKPQTSLNHYWTISPDTDVSTAVYASWGSGGGGGTGGAWNENRQTTGGPFGPVDINHFVDLNTANPSGESLVWQRASRNDHSWYGILSTINHSLSPNLTLLAGLDLRTYTGKHFYEVTDLLGGEYIVNNDDINNPNRLLVVGDKYNYNYDGQVGWQGVFGQLEYSKDKLSAFGTVSLSNTSYSQVERYNNVGTAETDKIKFFGYQVKGGANINLTDNHNVYANLGYFSKAPFYRSVFTSRTSNNFNTEAENEKILSTEIGYGYRSSHFNLNVNLYRTTWQDRSLVRNRTDGNGVQFFANILGIDAIHQGIEVDMVYNLTSDFRVSGMLSVADNQWANNVENATLESEDGDILATFNVFSDGLKVGDAAQTTAALGLSYTMFDGFRLGLDWNYFDNLYASFDPINRTTADANNVDAWQVPDYSTLDVNFVYDFDIAGLNSSIFGNVFNVTDVAYVADANDGTDQSGVGHNAQFASVYYAAGVTWTVGLKLRF